MQDRIRLNGIRAFGRHGANPGERDAEQAFDIELEMQVDLVLAEASDNLSDTVDYSKVHERILDVVRGTSFQLMERLAGEILSEIFRDPRILGATISIAKPGLLSGCSPMVILSRKNPGI